MAEFLPMIALSPTMEMGKITKWIANEGDSVESGDVLCEVETDKATMEYESTVDGTILKILAQPGDERAVGDPIAIIGEEGDEIEDLVKKAQSSGAPKKAAAPKPAEAEAETKEDSSEEKPSKPAAEQAPAPAPAPATSGGRIKASPVARKLAEKLGVDLSRLSGSGPAGRIVKSDVEDASKSGAAPAAASSSTARPTARLAPPKAGEGDTVIPISQKRQVIAQRLSESKFTAPHYYLRVAADVDEFIETRRRYNESAKDKISFNAILIKLVAQSIARHPIVNSTWSDEGIIQHGSIDIALAVAQEDGLITPVVRNCAGKGILEIDAELRELIDKALNNRLTPEEYTGATFTISNLGAWGIEEFTAIINPPGSAILAVGEMKKEAVVISDSELTISTIMRMTLSCDHRIIDGAAGATFLKDLKDSIENPIRAMF